MRHLHLGKYYPPRHGGMETVLREQCRGLAAAGHTVQALVAGDRDAARWDDPDRRLRVVTCREAAVVASQPVVPGLPSRLRAAWRDWRPEAVTLHWPNPLAAAVLLALWREAPPGARLYVWYHADVTRQRAVAPLLAPLLRAVWRRAAGVAVSAAELRDRSPHLAAVRDRVRVIPFGIDPGGWRPAAGGPGERFLFVGRLVYYKGLDVLLEALARVPAATLDVVGDGPLRRRWRERARALGVADRVRWLGDVPDAELPARMAAARALVLPSTRTSETFGLVQLEAMAAGVPVIASRLPTGAGRVVVDGVTGRLVPPGDAAALAAALRELSAEPERARRWGAAGRERFLDRYTRRRMTERLEAWYREPGRT